MQTRQLGTSDLHLSVIGLGTWAIGGGGWDYGWGPQQEAASIKTVLAALEQGINWIDTAPVYGFGTSETSVGKAIKEWGDEVFIATKCGLTFDDVPNIKPRLKKDSIIREAEASLKRIGCDVIDLYQIHWPRPDGDIEEAFKALHILKKQGKIRYAGVSNFSVEQMERVSIHGTLSSLQPPFSLLAQDILAEALPWCQRNDVGVLAYSPLQCGLLTGKVTKEWINELPEDDWRKSKSEFFQDPILSAALAFVKSLAEVSKELNCSLTALAISWVLNQKGITSAIAGARKPEQIIDSTKAAGVLLDENSMDQINQRYTRYAQEILK